MARRFWNAGYHVNINLQMNYWPADVANLAGTTTPHPGRWNVTVIYGRQQIGLDPPTGNEPRAGGVALARLTAGRYLVTVFRARIDFCPSDELEMDGKKYTFERVEEGRFEDGEWIFERV